MRSGREETTNFCRSLGRNRVIAAIPNSSECLNPPDYSKPIIERFTPDTRKTLMAKYTRNIMRPSWLAYVAAREVYNSLVSDSNGGHFAVAVFRDQR